MRTVVIHQPRTESLVSQARSLFRALKGAERHEQLLFDLDNLQWACPMLILPLAAYIQGTNSTFQLGARSPVKGYLNRMSFPTGVDSVSAFTAEIQKLKTYVPISVLRQDSGTDRERLETCFLQMIFKIIKATAGSQSAIYYPITEAVTNIFEHSGESRGFVFGQVYPSKDYLDISIVDTGRGLARAYADELGKQFSDLEAIKEAMSGVSTKKSVERGYGMRTSKRVVCEALGGGFLLMSGNAILVHEDGREQLAELPDFHWDGVIISYRIPRPSGSVDISRFYE